jgi:ATP-dependent protease ClpP protease subunit
MGEAMTESEETKRQSGREEAASISAVLPRKRDGIESLAVIGQIEGHYALTDGQKATKYEHVIPMLVEVEQNEEIEGLLVLLNTMGGDVEAGLAIAEMIATMQKPVVTLVLGGGHSIGVPLAVAGKRSFIVPSATMTLHPVRMNGLVIGVPQAFRYFEDMQRRIVRFICSHSSAREETVTALMMRPDQLVTDVGSVIEGREAVEYGIIDEVGGLDCALRALREMIAERKAAKNDEKAKKS